MHGQETRLWFISVSHWMKARELVNNNCPRLCIVNRITFPGDSQIGHHSSIGVIINTRLLQTFTGDSMVRGDGNSGSIMGHPSKMRVHQNDSNLITNLRFCGQLVQFINKHLQMLDFIIGTSIISRPYLKFFEISDSSVLKIH